MRFLAIGMITAALVAGMVGCSTTTVSKYGKAIPTGAQVVPAKDILANPTGFEGKEVVVTGKITSECPSGGWVWVKDASGEIYVNMHPTNVFIPQKVGKTVKAMGTVVLEQGRPQVVGAGLEF
jgi:uncharacterized protein YdeI (BOF family)